MGTVKLQILMINCNKSQLLYGQKNIITPGMGEKIYFFGIDEKANEINLVVESCIYSNWTQ